MTRRTKRGFSPEQKIGNLERQIRSHGFAVRYVDWCEDAQTPGLLGQIRGVTDRRGKVVKIGRMANQTQAEMIDILRHELRHIEDPGWDCGNRAVWHKMLI
jgi:hypothetical protein